jgi:hypothetical protein
MEIPPATGLFFRVIEQELLVLPGCRVKRLMAMGCIQDAISISFRIFIYTSSDEFFPYILCGSVIGMNYIRIKTIIPEIIDHQFISRKVEYTVVGFCELMYSIMRVCFAAIVFNKSTRGAEPG